MGLFGGKKSPALVDVKTRQLVERAMAELEAKTACLDAIVHFGKATWTVDQEKRMIVFDRKDGIQVTAPVQIIGTFNTADGTWLWAWDHPSVDETLQRDAAVVQEYGRKHNIPALTTRKLSCRETDCWEFTALACKLCDAQGAYRGPAGSTLVFMTFGEIQLSSQE